jgi:hypothetical protein
LQNETPQKTEVQTSSFHGISFGIDRHISRSGSIQSVLIIAPKSQIYRCFSDWNQAFGQNVVPRNLPQIKQSYRIVFLQPDSDDCEQWSGYFQLTDQQASPLKEPSGLPRTAPPFSAFPRLFAIEISSLKMNFKPLLYKVKWKVKTSTSTVEIFISQSR